MSCFSFSTQAFARRLGFFVRTVLIVLVATLIVSIIFFLAFLLAALYV